MKYKLKYSESDSINNMEEIPSSIILDRDFNNDLRMIENIQVGQ